MAISFMRNESEFSECIALQRKIWGKYQFDVVPSHILKAYSDGENPYGILLSAHDQNQMIGFLLAFPTSQANVFLLHMLGVDNEKATNGVGNLLIDKLREICEERAINKIVFTYDPLESRNANLYIKKQKAKCIKYVENYYNLSLKKDTYPNEISDEKNIIIPEDRFKMEIDLSTKNVSSEREIIDNFIVHIPRNFKEVKSNEHERALSLRKKTRDIFDEYINKKGYEIEGFYFKDNDPYYKLVLCS